jgi:phosphoglycerol transferase MdoB-like AlkP superfamily enzyme
MLRNLCQIRQVQYLVAIFSLLFTLFSVLRIVFYAGFWQPDDEAITTSLLLQAWSVGMHFDWRLSALVCLPLFIVGLMPGINFVASALSRRLAAAYVVLAVAAIFFIYIIDFGHYAYLGIRVDSSVLDFLGDVAISAEMMWETYPVVWISLTWLAVTLLLGYLMKFISAIPTLPQQPTLRWQRGVAYTVIFFLAFGIAFGRFSRVPLRWNDAFINGSEQLGAMGLNPVLYFADSFEFAAFEYDEQLVRKYYPQISSYLGVTAPDQNALKFDRDIDPSAYAVVKPGERPPNVVFIMLESLGANRLGIFNNPLDPTPNIDRLAREGWMMRNMYVPITSTARTVFGSISGLGDVSTIETATRNPLITEQQTIVNAWTGHDKYYFIGGSASWANMSAFIERSIKGIEMHQEGSYSSPVIDVWGISDLDLFKEADKVLRAKPKDKPFFAYIQTAGNHRPFTIPKDNDGFKRDDDIPEAELRKWGFLNIDQYNAIRLLDFNIGRFMEIAKEGGYFDNTIFVMFGDHNDRSTTSPHMASFHDTMGFDILHIPGIIYAPKYIAPRETVEATSMLDLLPTAAGLTGVPYTNTTMGRDINRPAPEGERLVFSQRGDKRQPFIHAISDKFLLRMKYDMTDIQLYDIASEKPDVEVGAQYPEKTRQMSEWLKGYYETTKYLHYHNSPRHKDTEVVTNR